MKTEISRVFRKNALVFWRNPIFRENRFFAKFRDKQDNIDLNIVFAAPLSGGPFRPGGAGRAPPPPTPPPPRPARRPGAGGGGGGGGGGVRAVGAGGGVDAPGPANAPPHAAGRIRGGRSSPVCGRGWSGAFRTLAGRGVKKLTQVLPLSLFFYTFTCFFYDKVKFARAFPPPCRGRKGVRSGERLLKTNLISK